MYYIDYKDWFKQNIEEFNDYFAPEFAFKNIKIAYAIASATLTYYTNKIGEIRLWARLSEEKPDVLNITFYDEYINWREIKIEKINSTFIKKLIEMHPFNMNLSVTENEIRLIGSRSISITQPLPYEYLKKFIKMWLILFLI